VLLLLAGLLLGAACGPTGGATPTAVGAGVVPATSTPTPEPTATEASTHACDHPYFPAVEGASWTYASDDSSVGPYSFTDSVTNLRSDGFTLRGDFDGLIRTQEWSCSEDGLALLDYSGMGAAQVVTNDLQVEFQTTDMSGITLPAGLAPGDEWAQEFTIAGTLVLTNGVESSAEGTASSTNHAVAMESVSVAAGTFDALRIERTIVIDLHVQYGETTIPVQVNSQEVVWFAEGVGMVKDSFTGSVASMPVNESIDLTGYSIP